MDARKVFDVVCRNSGLVQMYDHGICGPLWNVYADMYTDIESKVCINGELSWHIKEVQGI